jgi:hypothetical protein
MSKTFKISDKIASYRFEFLLISLVLLLFDKMFFTNAVFFTKIIWPLNMITLGIASIGIFNEKIKIIKWTKNFLFILSLIIPLSFAYIVQFKLLTELSFAVYFIYYTIIFIEVLRQIVMPSETTISVVFGSISGFLLLIVISQFVFLTIEYNFPHSFNGVIPGNIPSIYNQLSYFSMVTLCTIGYGDIAPISETARLTTMFFAIVGQFYLIALVGIIISRFNTK